MSSFKLVVVGGGAGGLAVASQFATKLPPNALAIIEPREVCSLLIVIPLLIP